MSALSDLAAMNAAEAAFVVAYRRTHCPACRKRVSAANDSIDARFANPTVRMVCHHCDHRWEVPRQPEAR